jgi:hypothetical protein
VATPTIDALVKVASLMTGRTFEPEARTLERMGLAGLNAPAIQEIVRKGFTV